MGNGRNIQSSRDFNRALVLKIIKKRGPILRKDIADITGLTKAAVTKIVHSFIEAKIVIEEPKSEKDGRKKVLSLRSGQNYMVAVYLGQVKLIGALFDLDGELICREELYEGVKAYDNASLPLNMTSLIKNVIANSGVAREKIMLIGIAAPGAINSEEGIIFEQDPRQLESGRPIPYNWRSIELIEKIKSYFNLPVLIDNNSNLAALAEYWFGVGLHSRNFIVYTIGAGIGAGAILDGKLYRGHDNIVCEIGHTTIDYRGKKCFCGNRGCLEPEGRFRKIVERYRIEKGNPTEGLNERADMHSVVSEMNYIIQKEKEGEPEAVKVIRESSKIMAIGAVTLVNLFNPELIVIAKDNIDDIDIARFVEHITDYVRANTYSVAADKVRVVESELGNDIQLYGAYAMTFQNILENYHLIGGRSDEAFNSDGSAKLSEKVS